MSGIEMYREHILEHYKSPQNFGTLEAHDIQYREDNPLCGDDIEIQVKLDDEDRIAQIAFHGQGCAISQASASLFTEHIKGRPVAEIEAMTKDDVLELLGIPISPVRMKCALLALSVVQNGIRVRDA